VIIDRALDRVWRGFPVSDGRKPVPMAESRHSAVRRANPVHLLRAPGRSAIATIATSTRLDMEGRDCYSSAAISLGPGDIP
jgi:hypothetical protein